MSEYLAMGGHAGFIWSSYGVAAIVLVGLLVASLREHRARREEVAALEAASPRRRQQAEPDSEA
ncbi:MAG: heme exporter protein CcmD [Rhodospirillaceae bacterium]|jgi:heme exporter protein D|nr:heme exporter protein CcmD [Rhodospirillaceae bacterium]